MTRDLVPRPRALSGIISLVLILAFLPSWTALSQTIAQAYPDLFRLVGPLNPLKLFSPLLLVWLFTNRAQVSRKFWFGCFALLAAIGVSTLISASHCAFRPSILREGSVLALGFIGALSFVFLPRSYKRVVILCWMVFLTSLSVLDFFSPQATDWLLEGLFDPKTRLSDFDSNSVSVLTAVFGQQSLAKLWSWLPWLFLYFWSPSRWVGGAVLIAAILPTGLTGQRGPLLALGVGTAFYFLARLSGLRSRARFAFGASVAMLVFLLCFAYAPNGYWKTKFTQFHEWSGFLIPQRTEVVSRIEELQIRQSPASLRVAEANVLIRKSLSVLSWETIARNPLGQACIAPAEFEAFHIAPMHSHSLFLEQFLQRGWLWGLFHALAWLGAFFRLGFGRDPAGRVFLLGGLTSVVLGGFFDHPWAVTNHALILCVFLLLAWFPARWFSAAETPSVTAEREVRSVRNERIFWWGSLFCVLASAGLLIREIRRARAFQEEIVPLVLNYRYVKSGPSIGELLRPPPKKWEVRRIDSDWGREVFLEGEGANGRVRWYYFRRAGRNGDQEPAFVLPVGTPAWLIFRNATGFATGVPPIESITPTEAYRDAFLTTLEYRGTTRPTEVFRSWFFGQLRAWEVRRPEARFIDGPQGRELHFDWLDGGRPDASIRIQVGRAELEAWNLKWLRQNLRKIFEVWVLAGNRNEPGIFPYDAVWARIRGDLPERWGGTAPESAKTGSVPIDVIYRERGFPWWGRAWVEWDPTSFRIVFSRER